MPSAPALMLKPSRLAAPPRGGAVAPIALLAPAAVAGEWDLLRSDEGAEGSRQTFASLELAAANLAEAEPFVLALPLSLGLVQRLSLPAAEAGELDDMARIQLEKILPYPIEAVAMALTEVERSEGGVTVAVSTVQAERLNALCQPLADRGAWPVRVVFLAELLAGGLPAESGAFLYPEEGRYVLGVQERGRLGFAQAVRAHTEEELAAELPATLLGAELEGIPTDFAQVALDRAVAEWSGTLRAALNVPVEIFDAGRTGLLAAGLKDGAGTSDLSPASWRAERLRGERIARLRRRSKLAAGIYLAALVLAFAGLGALWLRTRMQRAEVVRLREPAEYSTASASHWRTLAPAVDPSRYLTETMREVYECLPADSSVLWTAFDVTPRTISVQGEAPTVSGAVDFTEKLKARPGLRIYRFEAEPATALPNGRARFHVTGTIPERS